MRINGVNRLACKVLMRDLLPKKAGKQLTITIEPIRGLPVEKDLVVDMEPFFDAYRAVKPYLITSGNPPAKERIQAPPTGRATTTPPSASCVRAAPPAARCTGARVSTSARPRSSTHTGSSSIRVTRRRPSRLDILNEVDGVWRCRLAFNCTEACAASR